MIRNIIKKEFKGAGMMDSISSGVIEGLIRSVDRAISEKLIQQNSDIATVTRNVAQDVVSS